MKILHICPLYYPSIGGNQMHIQMLSEKLVELGEEVHVFTSNVTDLPQFFSKDAAGRLLSKEEDVNGVKVRRFPVNYRFFKTIFRKLFHMRGGYRLLKMILGNSLEYWQHGPMMLGMLNGIGKLKPDVMMATNNFSFTSFISYLAKKFFHIPFVFMPITHIGDPWTFHPILKTIYDSADLLVACTEFEKKHLMSQGVPEEKITVLPLGVPWEEHGEAQTARVKQKYQIADSPVISYLGRKVAGKGIDTLIQAMQIIWHDYPDTQLLLAGQRNEKFGEEMDRLLGQLSPEEKKRTFNIDNFLEEDKKDFYAVSDVIAMPSHIDAFGMVYLEAWAWKKPVIACRDTPQESIIRDGEDGFLIEYGNKEELASVIGKLLSEPELKVKMGEKGQQSLRTKYNLDRYAEKFKDAYHQRFEGKT